MAWFEHDTSRIYFEESGTGIPVLILPGFSGSIQEFAALSDTLSSAGYRVISADLPGSGRSEPQPRHYPNTFYDDDARSFAALLQHLGAVPAHLIGFSDGGECSLLMAATNDEVSRSVLTWGAGGVLSDPTGQLRAAMMNVIDNPIPPLQGFSQYLVATYGEFNARVMTQSQTQACSDIIDHRGGDVSLSKASKIACPVLLIAGEHDIFVPPALIEQYASRAPYAEALVAAGAGHDVHHARPEWLTETILDWLKKH